MKLTLDLPGAYYPRSFLKLLLVGFALVSAPLVVAFVYAAIYVDRLAGQAQTAVDQAAQAARESRLLIEQATSMERLARQYAILDDASIIDGYATVRARFKRSTSALSLLPLDESQLGELNRTIDAEQALFERLAALPSAPEERVAIAEGYAEFASGARRVLEESNALIDREIARMRETAAAAQRALLIQLVATLPLGAAVAALIAFLIARPIRQLDAAIRRLGEADLDRRVHVEGPADLAYLGERLDWLRRRLAALEHQKANFLRHVSHELKTPLTALREGAELLADGTAGPLAPQQREIVAIVHRAAGELARLIEALLDYQRAAASLASLELDRADLADIARRAVAPHALAAEARGVTIDLEAASAVIVADAEKLRVAVDNLVSNALKFSPRGGRVAVTVRPEGENAILEVADEGPGVLPEDRERVFEWFFRGEEDRGGAVRGSGLGLAIARELVSAHGGRIEIVDEARPGAHFRVSLPVDGPRSEADGR